MECQTSLTLKPIEKTKYPHDALGQFVEDFGVFISFVSLGILPVEIHHAYNFPLKLVKTPK